MFFNPMNPIFYRLQLFDLIGITVITFSLFVALKSKEYLINKYFCLFIIFIATCFFGNYENLTNSSYSEIAKVVYLGLLSWAVYFNCIKNQISLTLIKYSTYSFGVILFGGILGAVLIFFGIETFLAKSTEIIAVALGVQDFISETPRITSFLKPTANITAAYIACMSMTALFYVTKEKEIFDAKFNLLFIITIFLIGLMTMSRGVVAILFSIFLTIHFFKLDVLYRRTTLFVIASMTITSFLILQFFTILYPLNLDIIFSNDPLHVKELVNLGTKTVENPVYYTREGIGSEKISLSIEYGINHYAWLKLSAVEIFKSNILFGVGIGNFSAAVADLSQQGLVNQQLSDFVGSQSQIFTLLAEVGLVGVLIFFFFVVSFSYENWREHITNGSPYSLMIPLNVFVILVLSIDMDVTSFRWIWVLLPILYSFRKL